MQILTDSTKPNEYYMYSIHITKFDILEPTTPVTARLKGIKTLYQDGCLKTNSKLEREGKKGENYLHKYCGSRGDTNRANTLAKLCTNIGQPGPARITQTVATPI